MARLLNRIADAITGNTRQTGDRVLSIAQKGLKVPLTFEEQKSVCASLVSQARK